MKEMIKKGLLVAIGISALTKEKSEKLVKEMIKQGKLKEKEGKELVQKLVKQSVAEQKRLQKGLGSEFKKSADAIILVTKNEINRLAARLKEYQKSVGKPAKKAAKKKK